MRAKAKDCDLIIVGGGAAGLFAAAMAIRLGVKALLIERKARPGSKVLMTANGRCNFTKDITPERFLKDIGPCAKFVEKAIRNCPPQRIISFFKSLHVAVRRQPDGRYFPADAKAATIVHAFGDLFRDEGFPLMTNAAVTGIQPEEGGFRVSVAGFDLHARHVLLATGGVSYPKLGSVGDGQRFAQALGHSLVPYRPGLIGFETAAPEIMRLAGRRFEDGRVQVRDSTGKTVFDVSMEVDCEKFGLSGAAIYNAQRFIEHAHLKDWTLEARFGRERFVSGPMRSRPLKEAIVTLGGVSTDEVDSETMESRLVPGLFFAGEMLDIDGPTGGYNLTLAFATAACAVEAVAERVGREATSSFAPSPRRDKKKFHSPKRRHF